jgi:hypothetical protein
VFGPIGEIGAIRGWFAAFRFQLSAFWLRDSISGAIVLIAKNVRQRMGKPFEHD